MKRRLLMQSAALATGALAGPACAVSAPAASESPARRVTITGLEVFQIPVNRRGDWLLTRLSTSAGVTGIGDASQGRPQQELVRLLGEFFGRLRSRSVFDVEFLRQSCQSELQTKGQPAAVALSGLEQCLWDIQGRLLALPCYELFGGRLQSRIRNYANINRSTDDRSPEGFARTAEAAVRAGFDAIKLAPWDDMPRIGSDPGAMEKITQLGIDRAAAVRKVIGPKRDLLLDAHSHFDLAPGLELAKRVEFLNLFWLEEVTPAVPVENLAAINHAARMPTAGGEMIQGVKGFIPYITAKAVDITMPDVKYCGGMLELKQIAALSAAAGCPVSPHGPASPVGNFAAAHVCATLPNFLILEHSFGEVPWRAELVEPHEELAGGSMMLSGKPGLGIALNERMLAGRRILRL